MAYKLQTILDHVGQIREAIYGEEVRGSISDSIELMAYETDTIQGFKDWTVGEINSFKSKVESDMQSFQQQMTNNYIQFTLDINHAFDAYKAGLDTQFKEYKDKIDHDFVVFTTDMTTKFDTLDKSNTKFKQDVELQITQFTAEMLNKYQDFTANVIKENSEFKESVKLDIAGIKNDMLAYKETVDKGMADHKLETDNTLAKYQQELGETIEAWNKTLTDKLAQNTIELEAIKKDIEDKLAEAGQTNPNLELTDAREGEATLKDNLTKNYAKKDYVVGEITDLKTTTQDLGGRTDKLEEYVTTHKNPVLSVNQRTPDEAGSVTITTSDIKTPEGKPIEDILQNANANDLAARKEIIDIKLALKEKLAIDFINKTGIGFYDTFENTEYVDTSKTTATHNSSNKNVEFNGELKQATGNITLKANPSVGETITVGTTTYIFKETPTEETDIQIGTNLQATADNLITKLNTNSLVEVV